MQPLWRKRYVMAGWLTLSAVSLVLLIAAVKAKNSKVCKGINVEINGIGNNFFVDGKEVTRILTATGPIKGEALTNINLRLLEGRLKKDKWIADAQLFFDNEEMLQVVIEEKDPVARIFTVEGSSFYIDTACNHLPLSDKLSARVPMFTNFPTNNIKLSKPDSELLTSVKELAMFVQADDFWKAQVAQVDITPEGFVMIPTVGNHSVMLGNGEDYKDKFDRLYSFYKQVWTKVGLEKYDKIDVRFIGQVVTTTRGSAIVPVDSTKAKDALNNLLNETKRANDAALNVYGANDKVNTATGQPVTKEQRKILVGNKQDKQTTEVNNTVDEEQINAANKAADGTEPNSPAQNIKVPKAVMKKPEQP